MSADATPHQTGPTAVPVVPLIAVPEGSDPAATATADVQLSIGGQPFRLAIAIPAGPTQPENLLPVYQGLTNLAVGVATQAVERQGQTISCQKGCGACCRQPVPIAESEARALAQLVARMPEPRQSQVRSRFAEGVQRLATAGLLDGIRRSESMVDLEVVRSLGMGYFHLGIACPFLEDESCSIHPDRPLACRQYLVTSPAENCARPTPESIRRVPLPVSFFGAARAIDEKTSPTGSGWLTLLLALEWAEQHPEPPPPRPGPAWLQEFFGHLSSRTGRAGETVPAAGQVASDNLRPFLTALGWVIGYGFAEGEWAAIASGVGESDGEAGRWSEHEFLGGHRVKVRLARDPEDGVQIRLEVPREVEPQVKLALAIFQHFHLREPSV